MELRQYNHEDLALMPPRPCELKDSSAEHEMAEIRKRGPAYTVWGGHFNTEPIGAAGIIVFRDGVGEAWLRGSERMEEFPRGFARIVKRNLERAIEEHGLHRVQITVKVGDWRARSFAHFLGFEIEGKLRQLGADRSDYLMMSRIANGGQQ